MAPRARDDRLVVQELADEVLVYDLSRHKAHCLNRTAAFIWRHCDGRTNVTEMAKLLRKEVKFPVDEGVVWFALDRLGRAHLLRERVTPPTGARRLSRREVMRKSALVGGLSVLVPAVMSILAPTVAQAVSPCADATCEKGGATPANNCNGCKGGKCKAGGTCVVAGGKCDCV